MGAQEALRDMETGQEVSRAAAIPGPTVEQGARVAMGDPGIRAPASLAVYRYLQMNSSNIVINSCKLKPKPHCPATQSRIQASNFTIVTSHS